MSFSRKFFAITITVVFITLGTLVNFTNGQEYDQAMEFNQRIVDTQNEIQSKIDTLNMQLKSAEDKATAENMILVILLEVENLSKKAESFPYPVEATEFRNSALSLFEFYHQVLENDYTNEFVTLVFDDSISEEEFDVKYNELMDRINDKFKLKAQEFQNLQENFAHDIEMSMTNSNI